MDVIESTHNPLVKLLRSLERRKERRETGLFVAEGLTVLSEARRAGWAPESVIIAADYLQDEFVAALIQPWRERSTRMVAATSRVMEVLSGQSNFSPVIGVFRHRLVSPPDPAVVSGTWIALDSPRDPGNVGTIIRTAHASATKGLMLVGNACDAFGREAVRAAMGSIFHVPVALITEEKLIRLAGAWPGDVIAAEQRKSEDFRRTYRRPALVILGSEGQGLSPSLAAVATHRVAIPMPGGTESLNLAVSAALLLYQLLPSINEPSEP